MSGPIVPADFRSYDRTVWPSTQ